MFTTDVLIVGAGPAGLATAISALRHGARVLVVERRTSTSSVPRATGVQIRTMELFRIWGVADAVRAGGLECEPTVAITRSLVDEPLEVVPLDRPSLREVLAASPAFPILAPQDHIEPVLVDEVRRLGGEVRFGRPLTSLRVGDGVRAVVGRQQVRARFVVGADGPRSTVRAALGIGWERLGTIGDFDLVLFRAAGMPSRPSALNFVKHPDAEGVLLPMGAGRWGYVRAERGPWTTLLRQATGLADLDPEIIGTSRFTMAADVASRYRAGPGFVVGDAAHRMTPYAGVGLNTAVHDGHELGWRLAWAVRGIAGDALLTSWAAEREPVGRVNAVRSLNSERHPDDGLPRDLGGTYRSSAILDDGAPPAVGHHRTARPGERAPHVWFRRDGVRRSTVDLFDGRLTVLAGPAYRGVAPGGVPAVVLRVGRDLPDPRGAIQRAYRLGPESAVLVRPDGVVAWRQDGPSHPAALAAAVRTAVGQAVPAAMAG